MLRVLLGVPWFFPDSFGGTEVYVRGLAHELRRAGVDVAVATPIRDSGIRTDTYEEIRVFRFPAGEYRPGGMSLDSDEPREWGTILDQFQPNVVDLHALASGLELPHLRAAHRRGARTVTTLHLPGVVCARGTFMRFGASPCPGDLDRQPCTACRLHAQGFPTLAGRLLASVPPSLAGRMDRAAWTPELARRMFTARLQDDRRRSWLKQVVDHSHRLVAPSSWLADVLASNGVPSEKIVLCRQGVDLSAAPRVHRSTDHPVRVGFVGRFDPVKGLHVLVDAFRHIPAGVPIELHIWGVAHSPRERAYREAMVHKAARDQRLTFRDDAREAASIYSTLDLLAVPSLWLETGPLVVLEAQAAGLPVVGSNLGGIAERVTDGKDGVLVPAGEPAALAQALTRLAMDRGRLELLRPTRRPRSISEVGRDTLSTYVSLVTPHAA